jgi:peroxiredoxin Q/BCP
MKLRFIVILIVAVISFVAEGQNLIDFQLKSATNQKVFYLSKAKGKFVALHFLLKTECPFCLKHTHEHLVNADLLTNVIQVFIKPDSEAEIKQWMNNLAEPDSGKITIYRDPDGMLADKFNIPGGYSFHNQIVHFPALILLDTNGIEVFRYIGKDNTDRYSFSQLKEKINELTVK